jgi:pimeloyl-ACP methyl ester carboxylesterase
VSKKNQTYTTDAVTSKDGTKIGYRKMGSGPGIVLLHGGVNASQHLMKLGTALSDSFTIYIPDRRGRGMSGLIGHNYSIQKEDEDLDALLKKTGAHYVFGTADGALFALHAAITLPAIHKVAAYEPLLFFGQPDLDQLVSTMDRFDREMAEGKLGDAMVTSIKGAKEPKSIYWLPRFLLAPFFAFALKTEARKVKGDNVPLQELLSTIHDEIELVKKTEGTLENYKDVSAKVLLLNGSKSRVSFKDTLDSLSRVLPNSKHIELKGLNHRSAQDYGKPEIIAQELKRFFRAK